MIRVDKNESVMKHLLQFLSSKRHSMILRTVMTALLLVLIAAPVFGVGYAPLGVLGKVTTDGAAVEGATISLKAFIDGEEVATSKTVRTNSQGMFYNILTIRDGDVVDVQVTIQADEVYVELLENAVGWNDYEISLELTTDEFVQQAKSSISAPSDPAFDEDLQRIEEGDVDQELLDKYDAVVEEYEPYEPPVLEEPGVTEELGYVPAPPPERDASWWSWRLGAILLFAGCLLFIRYEIKSHKK